MSEWLLATVAVPNWMILCAFAVIIGIAVLASRTLNDSFRMLTEAKLLFDEVNALLDEANAASGQEPSHDPS